MLKDLHIAHLIGGKTVIKNNLRSDEIIFDRTRLSVDQMFFKPYESKKEFIFCARNTAQPILIIGLGLLNSTGLALAAGIILGASFGCAVVGGGMHLLGGNKASASFCIDMADHFLSMLCQTIINLVVLPLTAIALVTRSISTGLKAMGIYDYSAPKKPSQENSSTSNYYGTPEDQALLDEIDDYLDSQKCGC